MKQDKGRARRIFDFRRKGTKPGFCHCCGLFVTDLTDEHAPPLRTQRLIPETYLVRNSMAMVEAHNRSKRNLPPGIKGHGGFRFRAFCEVCQQKTQKSYGEAFFNWTNQGLAVAQTVTDFDSGSVSASFRIQPLNIIKQMASNALAVSAHSTKDDRKRRLIRFVQKPAEKKIPQGVRFLLYLNPIRPNYELPQCRFEHDQTQLDVVRQISTALIAEIAVPPFGVALLSDNGHRLPPHLLPLLDIGHFGDYSLDEVAVVNLHLPVRTVFGPAALRFWQDAAQENAFGASP